MTWRSIAITKASYLKYKLNQLVIQQNNDEFSVPIEDIAVIVIDSLQVTLTSKLLSACMVHKIAVVVVDETHIPNGLFLPYMSHSRQLKTITLQQSITGPTKKKAWQKLVKYKLINQAECLRRAGQAQPAKLIDRLSGLVRSGDPDNYESQAAQVYFPAIFEARFIRSQDRFHNAAINYGYALVRSAIARSLTIYGFLPVWGLHHHSQLNAFNLADDLIEPFRAFVDAYVVKNWPTEPAQHFASEHKAILIQILAEEVIIGEEQMNIVSATQKTVKSLVSYYRHKKPSLLHVPQFIDEPSE